jgi:hypothetical protein
MWQSFPTSESQTWSARQSEPSNSMVVPCQFTTNEQAKGRTPISIERVIVHPMVKFVGNPQGLGAKLTQEPIVKRSIIDDAVQQEIGGIYPE